MGTRRTLSSTALVVTATLFATLGAGCDKADNNNTGATGARSTSTTQPSADNTARNKGDIDRGAKTPMDQGQSAADVKISAEIRRAILDDKAMSVNAQNCKVITENGRVTLRGPVDSQTEKESVERKAAAVAGVLSVDNQLEVKTK